MCMWYIFGTGRPNSADILHLGRWGTKIFCSNIKRVIMKKGKNQATERFSGGGGNFAAAAGRGHHDGYQVR